MLWLCLTISVVVVQVPSPTGQLVSSVPLEQTPAEEESRKSMSRSFKGTMASSTERRFLFFWKAFISFSPIWELWFTFGFLSSMRGRPDSCSCCWHSRENSQQLPGHHAGRWVSTNPLRQKSAKRLWRRLASLMNISRMETQGTEQNKSLKCNQAHVYLLLVYWIFLHVNILGNKHL